MYHIARIPAYIEARGCLCVAYSDVIAYIKAKAQYISVHGSIYSMSLYVKRQQLYTAASGPGCGHRIALQMLIQQPYGIITTHRD